MSTGVVLVVLLAAVLHVFWNTLVKRESDGFLATVVIAAGGALICAVALPFLPPIAPAAWPNVAGSVVAQSIYYPLVAAAYRAGDMTVAYPIMRGTAPLLVAAVSAPLLGEILGAAQWIGIGVICLGIWAVGGGAILHRGPGRSSARGVLLALVNAGVIATYTLIDGAGSRASGSPATYTAWIFLLTAVPMLVMGAVQHRGRLLPALRGRWWVGLAGGAGNVGAYGLVLWAMTLAPVAAVAALRETSIIVAAVVGAVLLHEKVDRYRIAGAVLIAAGAVVLRLA
ncbi:EamA family transporter [Nakamurella sp. YIM 132087]|uniref:EamA family transporter n=1 Tax=Nakamurella alba TaxID=2665158 RepID=A0A7K1FKC6_9ACTN|nr:DMT family transporter [Nakamurella alba]MTD13314.1 EamA family transporter [Nakamurella alba]